MTSETPYLNHLRWRATLALVAFIIWLLAFVTTLGVLITSGWWKLAVMLVASYIATILAEVW